MKKYLRMFISLVLLTSIISGCGEKSKHDIIIAKVNSYEITKNKFELEFKDSAYGRVDSSESRQAFLDNLINQKLILQYAEKLGLDRDDSFIGMIERFWEQSLLKIALDIKTKEIIRTVTVSDKEVEDAYHSMAREGSANKPYDEMYAQMKKEMLSIKQSQAMSDWIKNLRKEADIRIDNGLLKKDK